MKKLVSMIVAIALMMIAVITPVAGLSDTVTVTAKVNTAEVGIDTASNVRLFNVGYRRRRWRHNKFATASRKTDTFRFAKLVFALPMMLLFGVVPDSSGGRTDGPTLGKVEAIINEVINHFYPTDKDIELLEQARTLAKNGYLDKALNAANKVLKLNKSGHRDVYHVTRKFSYLRVMDRKFTVRQVETGSCRISDFGDYDGTQVLSVDWKALGFQHAPSKLEVGGKTYVDPRSTNGGLKKGTVLLVEEKFLATHQELIVEDYVTFDDPATATAIRAMENDASLKWQKSMTVASAKESFDLRKAAIELYNRAEELDTKSAKRLKNGKRPVSKANQGGALFFTPSDAIGNRPTTDTMCLVKDIERKVPVDGKQKVDPVNYETSDCDEWPIKFTDGFSVMSLSTARQLNVARNTGILQVRDNAGSIKGTINIVPDRYFARAEKVAPEHLLWSDCEGTKTKWLVFESVVKDAPAFGSMQEYLTKNHTIRKCDSHIKISGKIRIARQIFEAVTYGANPEDIADLVKPTAEEIKDTGTREGYYKVAEGILPEMKHPAFTALHDSPAVKYSVLKQLWNWVTKSCAGRIEVAGAELYCSPDIQRVIDILFGHEDGIYLKSGQIRVDNRTGLAIGQKVVLFRYPHGNPEPVIVTVAGYTDLPDIIEMSMEDMITVKLDADFDGDHIIIVWDERILRCAEKTLKLFLECGGATYVFEDSPASDAAKQASMVRYLTKCASLSNVGAATAPIFLLYSMIPFGAKPEDRVCLKPADDDDYEPFNPMVQTIIKMLCLNKVNITVEADSGKRMAGGKFGESEYGEYLKDLRKDWVPMSEFFAHPYEVNTELGQTVLYSKPKWATEDGDKYKYVVTGAEVRSAMSEVHDKIFEIVAGDKEIWYVDEEEGNSYKTIMKSEDNPDGFVWAPNQEDYEGVPMDSWFIPAGIAEYDELGDEQIDVDLESVEADEEIVVGETVVKGADFRNWLLHGFQEASEDLDRDENRTRVSLEANWYTHSLSVGILHHRMMSAALAINRLVDDGPRVKNDIRFDIVGFVKEIIVAWFYHEYGISISAEQAKIVLYDELGKYLLGKHANECTAADLQAFFAENEELIRRAIDNWTPWQPDEVEDIEDVENNTEDVGDEIDL